MRLETIRQKNGDVTSGHADVIATIRRIPDQNEVFGILARSNKTFNKHNVKFAANGEKITLNGLSVDTSKFGGLSKADKTTFLLDLPSTPAPTPEQSVSIMEMISSVCTLDNIKCTAELIQNPLPLTTLLHKFKSAIQEMLIKCLNKLFDSIEFDVDKVLKKVLPNSDVALIGLYFVICFFKTRMIPYEKCYLTQL